MCLPLLIICKYASGCAAFSCSSFVFEYVISPGSFAASKFCQLLLNGGALDKVRLLSPATVAFMMENHLNGDMADMGKPNFLNMNRRGQGFGLGFAVVLSPPRLGAMCMRGDASWGGMASTFFFVDPKAKVAAVLMTQLVPSSTYNFRRFA